MTIRIRRRTSFGGQQRLTSILLACLGYFPDKEKFVEGSDATMTNEDDSASDEQHDYQLLTYGKNRENKTKTTTISLVMHFLY